MQRWGQPPTSCCGGATGVSGHLRAHAVQQAHNIPPWDCGDDDVRLGDANGASYRPHFSLDKMAPKERPFGTMHLPRE
jgi:hypothetical protein